MIHQIPDPKDIEVISEINICEHHKKYPKDFTYAACSCSASYSMKYNIKGETDDIKHK